MSEANIVLPALTGAQVAILWFILASAVVGLLYGGILVRTVLAANPGPKSMTDVSDAVEEGAMAYLKRQVSTMSIFVVIIFFALFFMYRNVYHDLWLSLGISVAFLLGVGASYLAGFIGMWLAVRGNVRSANAALTSFKDAMELAFKAGGVSGMATVGLGLLGRHHHLPGLPAGCDEGAGRVRIRRLPGRPFYARRRRHLYQGGRCRRRSGRQS